MVGSLDVAIQGGTPAWTTRWLHARGYDSLLWRLDGGKVGAFLRRLAATMDDPSDRVHSGAPVGLDAVRGGD